MDSSARSTRLSWIATISFRDGDVSIRFGIDGGDEEEEEEEEEDDDEDEELSTSEKVSRRRFVIMGTKT